MRRLSTLAGAIAILALTATPAFAADGDGEGQIMIMKHACTEADVQSEADFKAIEAGAEGDAVTALALTVLACPTIVLADDEGDRTDGIAGPAVDFDFSVTDSAGNTQTIADAEFMAAKLCESDIERDANGDGEFSEDVCLDISHYVFSGVAVGDVTVTETSPPNGWRFGTLRLTPEELQGESDDQATGATFNAASATVTLDLSGDPDNAAMLHVYNFEGSPSTDTLPAASTLAPTTAATAAGIGLAVAAFTSLGLLAVRFATRRTDA